jgi:hypothetical protein
MPNLSLANTITSKPEHRQMLTVITANFGSGGEGFSATNAILDATGKRLQVTATATSGYAYQNFSVTPGVQYDVSFKWIQVGGGTQGSGDFKLGSTDNGVEYINGEFASGAATETATANFIATGPILYLRLQTDTNTKITYWDDIVINESATY